VTGKGTIERALEIAASGECRTIDDVRRRLSAERYMNIDAHLAGKAIRGQLRALMDRHAVAQGDGHIPPPSSDG
jgi:hypothetical protein